MECTTLVNLKNNSAFKMWAICLLSGFTEIKAYKTLSLAGYSFDVIFDKLYCTTSYLPAKIRVVSTLIGMKPKSKHGIFFLNRILFRKHKVIIFMFLHRSSHISSTKSTLFKSDVLTQMTFFKSDI